MAAVLITLIICVTIYALAHKANPTIRFEHVTIQKTIVETTEGEVLSATEIARLTAQKEDAPTMDKIVSALNETMFDLGGDN